MPAAGRLGRGSASSQHREGSEQAWHLVPRGLSGDGICKSRGHKPKSIVSHQGVRPAGRPRGVEVEENRKTNRRRLDHNHRLEQQQPGTTPSQKRKAGRLEAAREEAESPGDRRSADERSWGERRGCRRGERAQPAEGEEGATAQAGEERVETKAGDGEEEGGEGPSWAENQHWLDRGPAPSDRTPTPPSPFLPQHPCPTHGSPCSGVSASGVAAGGVSAGRVSAGGSLCWRGLYWWGSLLAGSLLAGVSAGGVSAGGVAAGGVSTGGVAAGRVSAGGVAAGGVSAGGGAAGGVSPGGGSWWVRRRVHRLACLRARGSVSEQAGGLVGGSDGGVAGAWANALAIKLAGCWRFVGGSTGVRHSVRRGRRDERRDETGDGTAAWVARKQRAAAVQREEGVQAECGATG
ncbi:unnamed protein product [Closterium sp. Naga37s-1]|nr:unnamed protein product [Closterium sp. Naga37s-1]